MQSVSLLNAGKQDVYKRQLECLTSSGRQNPMSRKLFRGLVKKYNGKMQEKKEKTGKFGLTVILSRYVSL